MSSLMWWSLYFYPQTFFPTSFHFLALLLIFPAVILTKLTSAEEIPILPPYLPGKISQSRQFVLKHIYAEVTHPTFGNKLAFYNPTNSDLLTTYSSVQNLVVDTQLAQSSRVKPSAHSWNAAFKNLTTNKDLREFLDKTPYVAANELKQPWENEESLWPNMTSNVTILSLAKMAGNAYLDPILSNTTDWYELEEGWPLNDTFGFETDGVRGHVFYSGPDVPDDSAKYDDHVFIIALKGTTASFLGGGGPTTKRDQINDNRLFSCCCARVGYTWKTVCDCYLRDRACSQDCLEQSLQDEDMFYKEAIHIYLHLSATYPDAQFWLTGHSLGGALSTLTAQTFGLPAVSFATPGDLLATRRLHLPGPPAVPYHDMPIWHVGHTADPIFQGVCQGPTSICWYGGYAMETRCHVGRVIVYDTVGIWNWRVNIQTHRMRDIIEKVLMAWAVDEHTKDLGVPKEKVEEECEDCASWGWE